MAGFRVWKRLSAASLLLILLLCVTSISLVHAEAETQPPTASLNDQQRIRHFANRMLDYYFRDSQQAGPQWLRTTDVSFRITDRFDPLYAFETIQPFGKVNKNGGLWFWQARYAHQSEGDTTANFGIGWRQLSADKKTLLGANVFYDHGFQYQLARVGLGLEYFNRQMEYRANWYRPVSGDRLTDTAYLPGGIQYSYIRAVEGFDFEVGAPLPDAPWWKLYVGGYHWGNQYNPAESGLRLRSAMQLTPRLTLEVSYVKSNTNKGETSWQASYNMADVLGPSFWGMPVVNGNGEIIGYSVQLYKDGKPYGEPILVYEGNVRSRFTVKATPIGKAGSLIASGPDKDDLSRKLLQKVARQHDIKTETFTKLTPYTGSVRITVTNGVVAVSGATVSLALSAAQTLTATTDAAGVATFSGIAPGSYSFSVSATGFSPASGSVAVTGSGGSASINLASSSYTITASAGSNGSISPSGAVAVAHGGARTFTFTPSSGYQVASVTVDGTNIGATPASYTFTNVTAAHTISATFSSIPTVNMRVQKMPPYNTNSYTVTYVSHGVSSSTTLTGVAGSWTSVNIVADSGSTVTVVLLGIGTKYVYYVDGTYADINLF